MLKILFSLLLVLNFTYASFQKDNIEAQMENAIDKVLMILKDSNLAKERKAEEIINLMNPIFDYELMSRLSLGKQWNLLPQEKKDDFIKVFTEKLKNSYVEKLDLYTDELVETLGKDQPKANRIILKTQLVGKEEKYQINYKFYEKSENSWLIYDVDLLGVSIIQTYRKQFSGFLKDKTFDELLSFLKDKNNSNK